MLDFFVNSFVMIMSFDRLTETVAVEIITANAVGVGLLLRLVLAWCFVLVGMFAH